jgi:hypothetical protein
LHRWHAGLLLLLLQLLVKWRHARERRLARWLLRLPLLLLRLHCIPWG